MTSPQDKKPSLARNKVVGYRKKQSLPSGLFSKKQLEKPPFSPISANPVSAAILGSSNETTSQTSKSNSKQEKSNYSSYRYAIPQNRLTIKPHGLILSQVFVSPNGGTLYKGENLVRIPNTAKDSFRSNKQGRWLGDQGRRKIIESINWIIQGSKRKYSRTGSPWRVSMITVTLCAAQMHDDKTLNKKALNQLLVQLRRWGMENYVWNRECQKNGSIHYHITCDAYIDKFKLRKTWNNILDKLGYLSVYKAKFENYTAQKYLMEFAPRKRVSRGENPWFNENGEFCNVLSSREKKVLSAFYQGKLSGWKNPNSTDVKAVRSINCVARYCAKHAVKISDNSEPDADGFFATVFRRTTGRKWGRSESITRLAKSVCYRSGSVSQLWSILMSVWNDLGNNAEFIEGERFKGLFFEPLSSVKINRILLKSLYSVSYRAG